MDILINVVMSLILVLVSLFILWCIFFIIAQIKNDFFGGVWFTGFHKRKDGKN